MRKGKLFIGTILCLIALGTTKNVYAKDETITQGITIGDIHVSGLTEEEATQKVNEYMDAFTTKKFTLDMDGNKADVTAGELGYYWKNTETVKQANKYCKEGNVIARYKEAKDIEKHPVHYDIEIDVNDEVMTKTIEDSCGVYNIPHKNATLKKVGGSFEITSESSGRMIDMDTSVAEIHDYLLNQWNRTSDEELKLKVVDDEPIATREDCAKVKDLIGSYSTRFSTGGSNYNRNKNMENGVRLLNGITVAMGETISVNSFLEPWTSDNGWYAAGTYVNGKVEDSLGGGICQVSSTLYNALLLAELDIVERFPHSMSVGYVPLSQDAALAGTWKDLKVRNNTETPIYIEGIYSAGTITFNIYGVETRPSNRKIEYKSETTATIPSQEIVTQDPTQPAGYRKVTSSGHTGYRARLLKYVYVDGKKESEEVVNTSVYASTPTNVTVGTGEQAQTPATAGEQPQNPTPTPQPQTSGEQETLAGNQNNTQKSETNTETKKTEETTTSAEKPEETTAQEGTKPEEGETQAPADNTSQNAGA